MAIIKRVAPASAFKVGLIGYGAVGLILGVLFALIALSGAPFAHSALPLTGGGLGIAVLIVCPIAYGIMGGITMVIGALLYNFAAGWVGGIEVDLT